MVNYIGNFGVFLTGSVTVFMTLGLSHLIKLDMACYSGVFVGAGLFITMYFLDVSASTFRDLLRKKHQLEIEKEHKLTDKQRQRGFWWNMLGAIATLWTPIYMTHMSISFFALDDVSGFTRDIAPCFLGIGIGGFCLVVTFLAKAIRHRRAIKENNR